MRATSKKYYCKCGKEIDRRSKHCSSCSHKGKKNPFYGKHHTLETRKKMSKDCRHSFKGKNNPNYIDGRSGRKYFCKDCPKQITKDTALYGGGRCKSCEGKRRHKLGLISPIPKGKKHPNYIDGRSSKKYYCSCGAEIDLHTALYGDGHCKSCSRKGKLNPNWRGGIDDSSEYGGEFDSSLKEKVRFRDGYKCQLCGCTQIENGKQLDVHHKDYIKKHNKLSNLISLCKRCHTKTNWHREYWVTYFREKHNVAKRQG